MSDVNPQQLECLTEAIYHEARGEDYHGQLYVGYVIKNRVMSDQFRNSYCGVINAPSQFSYTHELSDKTMYETDAGQVAQDVAHIVMTTPTPFPETMFFYHATSITPDWDFNLIEAYVTVGNHVFYTLKGVDS